MEEIRWARDHLDEDIVLSTINKSMEQFMEEGDRHSVWKKVKTKKHNTLPKSFEIGPEKLIFDKEAVLHHIRKKAMLITEPEEEKSLSDPRDHAGYHEQVEKEVERLQKEADTSRDWEPTLNEAHDMIRYLVEAHANKTAIGPDGIHAGHVIFAGPSMIKALKTLLDMIAHAARAPSGWRRMKMVLAHKMGRDPQNIEGSYRPICVGSLLAKAAEQVIQN